MMLTNLPVHLTGELLGVWFDLKAVVDLDTAFCNHKFRDRFLESLASSYCVHASKVNRFSSHAVEWYIDRQFKMCNLEFLVDVERAPIARYMQIYEKNVHTIRCKQKDLNVIAVYARNLTSFSFCNGPATDSLTDILWLNPHLRVLELSDTAELRASHLNRVELRHLKSLSWIGINCSGGLLGACSLAGYELTHLNLSFCTGLTTEDVAILSQSSPQLQYVGLCTVPVCDEALGILVHNCPYIAHLDISVNSVVTDVGILSISQKLRGLCGLAIGLCPKLTDQSLAYLVEHCAETLQVLRMNQFGSVRAKVFVLLLQRCTRLHSLSTNLLLQPSLMPYLCNLQALIVWSVLSDAALMSIAKHCQELQVLGNIHVVDRETAVYPQNEEMLHAGTARHSATVSPYTEEGLLALMHGLPNLRLLGLKEHSDRNCLSRLAVKLWQSLRPRLQVTSDGAAFDYHVLEQKV